MGGINEKPITSVPASSGASPKTLSKGRIHEDKGFVHFHDDISGIKVAVPTYVYEKQIKEWIQKSGDHPLTFVDTKNGTRVIIKMTHGLGVDGITLDAELTFEKVAVIGNAKALLEHAEAR